MSALASHPVAALEEDDHDEVDEEVHNDRDVAIKVSQSPGFLCHIEATAKMPLAPGVLFKQVITHPDNAAIFRHMDRCSYRQVLEDDGEGRRRVEVEHEATWRFLVFHGKFYTRLIVDEDDTTHTMKFELKPGTGGIMKKFRGAWQVNPYPDDPSASLSTLDQDLALAISLPPPFDRILKSVSCRQVRAIFEDIRQEADRMAKGKPTLPPWDEVKHKAIDGPPPSNSELPIASE